MWKRPICMAKWCTSGGAGCCRDPRLLYSDAQEDLTLPRLRRELQRPPGQPRLIVCGPNALRALVQVDLDSEAASGPNGRSGLLCRLGPLIQKAYSLVNLGSDAASGLNGSSGQRGRP